MIRSDSSPLRVGLVTCARLPRLDDDTRQVIEPLNARGIAAVPVVWDDPAVQWTTFDLAIVRCCWDYVGRHAEFLSWASSVPRLANPADVLAWNTDKRYLLDLADAGVPIVPTTWVDPDQTWTPPRNGDWVIKPAISIASLDTGRYRLADPGERRLAVAHVRGLRAEGRTAMIQPYLEGVDYDGETSLVYFAGAFSHAVRKAPVLDGPDVGLDRRFLPQGGLDLRARYPSRAHLALAERALAVVPGGSDRLLYARIDMVPGPLGEAMLMELELTEPQLYFGLIPETAERFASAAAAWTRAAQRHELTR